jgi:carbamoyl-phosphate synthase large subunit
MPRKVLVIGSGPIIIGQAAEFDYAGTQACRALREEGIEVVLVNSNPATIMTDEDMADRIYIEPLIVPVIERIIDRERPDGVLGTLGGQTGLNLVVDLEKQGILKKYGVKALGTSVASVEMAEDRDLFRGLLNKIGEPVLPSKSAESIDAAVAAGAKIGYPVIVRPSYTLGGTGGGIAHNEHELRQIATGGIAASKVGQVLVERSLLGWKEIEYEVMRDGAGNLITICNMENLDPMGVHTGDSIVVAPSQTLSDKDYQRLRTASLNIITGLDIKGACNVQLAYRPSKVVADTLGEGAGYGDVGSMYYVIEVNPRVSRSSALASKATGYPIARVAAKIALGKTLDEIPNAVTKKTTAAFEPALDYCVVKIPRWPFDKFPMGDRSLGTEMKATGEVMAIDRTFEAALQKAVRSMENGRGSLLWEDSEWGSGGPPNLLADDDRLWKLAAAIRSGRTAESVSVETGIDPWFTRALTRIIGMERQLLTDEINPDIMRSAKRMGFSDVQIGSLVDYLPEQVRSMRKNWGIKPVYKMVDTCAGEFEAVTPYFYSTYEQENEAISSEDDTAIVLGSGPIRIGQGIEFDYCSVHAAWALQASGAKAVMINSNPETVSTDFDTSDRLYFEPLDEESIRDIIENEGATSSTPRTMVQFGGQTAINLSQSLGLHGLPVLGSSPDVIDLASDRGRFEEVTGRHGLPQPPGGMASDVETALQIANNVGFPVLVRPSYVLGGRAMEIVQTPGELLRYFDSARPEFPNQTILIDHYLLGLEVEVDAVCDGEDILIPGIMQHIERAGVHSGDSMAVYPAQSLTDTEVELIVDYTRRIGLALGVEGLMNIQFVVAGAGAYRGFTERSVDGKDDDPEIYIIEVNPRSSRTIPFISKVTRIPMVRIATEVMRGKTIAQQGYGGGLVKKKDLIAIKAPVFSMSKLAGVDTYLGPEMKSTGEVMGIDVTFEGAITKALLGSGLNIPKGAAVLLSIADPDKSDALGLVRTLDKANHEIYATKGTAEMIRALGVKVTEVEKRLQSGAARTVVDIIEDGTVGAVVNTVTGDRTTLQDGFQIRRSAVMQHVPCFTSIDTARCAVESEGASEDTVNGQSYSVRTIAEYLES